MNIIAIDVSKNTLDILAGEDVRTADYSNIDNTSADLEKFLSTNKFSSTDWTVVMESTGDYHRAAAIFFLQKGLRRL